MLLTELPPEIIHHILSYVDPLDLAWIPRTCKSLGYAVKANKTLFKLVYLHHFDEPRARHDFDWEGTLKNVIRLQLMSRRRKASSKTSKLGLVYKTVTTLLKNATGEQDSVASPATGTTYRLSRNAKFLSEYFSSATNQLAFLCGSSIYERARGSWPAVLSPGPPQAEHQMSAHLHCLYGVPFLTAQPGSRQTRGSEMGPFACARVYDLRQYTERTRWGPFLDDGSDYVDWEKMESIMIVLGANLDKTRLHQSPLFRVFSNLPFEGAWPDSFVPAGEPVDELGMDAAEPVEVDADLLRQDPYGVTGTWLRVVCFLDYSDFFVFNFAPDEHMTPLHVPRRPIHYDEATRIIYMRLEVTRIAPPGPDDGQELPVVHFRGVSRSIDSRSSDDNAHSDIRGTVRLTPEGEVHWTTFSVFAGVKRWRSESIQVGGVRSARGVIGNWFDVDYDAHGPAGPTAFWKISDDAWSKEKVAARTLWARGMAFFREDESETGDNDSSDNEGLVDMDVLDGLVEELGVHLQE
ncbi:hypothetical protein F4780DRAFT_739541 [Xylariomycetidae sp. FL0641]|nr:hypothetical protein F4780DRAFT_739541 [Xylariomycetidae sp. FL0641]